MYSYGPPHMAVQKQDDQHEHTFSNYVRIQDVVQKTCLRRWTIGKSGERRSGISVLPARRDDDDNDDKRYIKWKHPRSWFELGQDEYIGNPLISMLKKEYKFLCNEISSRNCNFCICSSVFIDPLEFPLWFKNIFEIGRKFSGKNLKHQNQR